MRLERSLKPRGIALRKLQLGQDQPAVGDDSCHVASAIGVAIDGNSSPPVLALDLIGPVGLFDLGKHAQRHVSGRSGDEQVIQTGGRSILIRKAHHDVKAPVAFDDLGHAPAIGHGFERVVDGGRRHAEERRALGIDMDAHLRDQDLLLDLQIHKARDGGKPAARVFGKPAQVIKIVTVNFQHDFGAHAGTHMLQAMADRLFDVDRHRQHGERSANIGKYLFLGAA